jgi:hypothetical protein
MAKSSEEETSLLGSKKGNELAESRERTKKISQILTVLASSATIASFLLLLVFLIKKQF